MHKKLSKKKIEGEVFELTDIFEDVNEKNVAKNIEYLLRRNKLWSPKYHVVFPAGGLQEEKDDSYQYDFEVFSSPNQMKYHGTAYGSTQLGEMLDMNVELKRV